MFNFAPFLTSGSNGFDPPESKRGRHSYRRSPSVSTGGFDAALHLSSLEESKLESILRVGNLNQALESIEGKDDVATDTTALLPDDCSAGFRDLVENLGQEKSILKTRCQELEELVSDTRRDNDLWKVKMTMAMGSLRSQIDSLQEDNMCLEEKCQRLSRQLMMLRKEHESKLTVSDDASFVADQAML